MRTRNLFFICFIMFFSCSVNDDDTIPGYILDSVVELIVLDKNQQDLFDPTHPNRIHRDSIKVYFISEGEEILYHYPNLNAPNGFSFIFNEENPYHSMRLVVDHHKKGFFQTTIVQWSENDRDTFTSLIDIGPNHRRVIKLWFNDCLVWNVKQRFATIVK